MLNNHLKEIENEYRELGIEGDDIFTLIAFEYVNFHQLDLSDRLINIVKKAHNIYHNSNQERLEYLTKKIIKDDKLGIKLPILYQFFHAKRFRDNTGKFFTPINIVKSMVSMLPIKNDAVILDPTCGGGTFLVEISRLWKNKTCHLIANDIDNYLVTLTEIIMKISNYKKHKLSFFNENIYDPKQIKFFTNKIDYILANPPFSLTIRNFNPQSKLLKKGYKKSDALFLDLAKDLLKEGGKLVCLLPHSIISNQEYAELRKIVEEDWYINAVIVLPEGTFQETANTTTRADILILRKKGKGIFNSQTIFCNISSLEKSSNSIDNIYPEDDLTKIINQKDVRKALEIN